MLTCKNCKKPLLQKNQNKIKIRTNILVFEKAESGDFSNVKGLIKCPHCKCDNKIPIILNTQDAEFKHIIFD